MKCGDNTHLPVLERVVVVLVVWVIVLGREGEWLGKGAGWENMGFVFPSQTGWRENMGFVLPS